MFSFQEYIIGWLIYFASVIGLLAISWGMTRCIPWRYVQQALRLIVATFLLLPAGVDSSTTHMAPAWIKGFLLLVFGGMEGFLSVGRYLLLAVSVVFLVYGLLLLAIYLYQKQFSKVKGRG